MFLLRSLGSPRVLDASGADVGLPQGKPLAVLLYVALAPGAVSRQELAQVLWPGVSRSRALQSVRQAVWLLRRTLGDEVVHGSETLEVDRSRLEVDVHRLGKLLDQDRLSEAGALWEGPFLENFHLPGLHGWEEWATAQGQVHAARFSRALVHQATADAGAGHAERAAAHFRTALRVDPFFLPARAGLISALLDARDLDGAGRELGEARRFAHTGPVPAELLDLETRFAELLKLRPGDGDPPLTLPSCVGRQSELSRIRAAWQHVREGWTSVVVLAGPPGVGKTRLALEAAANRPGSRAGRVVVKASEDEARIEWGFVGLLARSLLALPGSAGITAASATVLRGLVPGTDQGPPSRWIPPLHPQQSGHLADALNDLLSAVAFENPLLVILDDVQWIDEPSRSLLGRILRETTREPILFILTVQEGDLAPPAARTLRTLERESHVERLPVQPLSRDETAQFLSTTVGFRGGDMSGSVVDRLHTATGGNPLFLVELLQSFVQQGIVVAEGGRWWFELDRLPASIPLPRTLHAAVRERLARLGPDAALVAAWLARLPARATPDALRRTTGLDDGRFLNAASELVERDVAQWQGDRLVFTHDALRDAVHDGLSRAIGGPEAWGQDGPGWKRLTAPGVAAAAVLVLLLGALSWMEPGQPLHGGGELRVRLDEGEWVATPGEAPGGAWRVTPAGESTPTGPDLRGPFLTAAGHRRWFVARPPSPGGTPSLVETGSGTEEPVPLLEAAGLDLEDLHPDGHWMLASHLDPSSGEGLLSLVRDDGSDSRVLLRTPSPVPLARWSPGGGEMVVVTRGLPDSLLVLSGSGARIAGVGWRNVWNACWAGPQHVVFVGERAGLPRVVRWDLTTGTAEPLPAADPLVGAQLACSPDGSGVIAQASRAGAPGLYFLPLDGGRPTLVPIPADGVVHAIRWIPEHVPPLVTGVEITALDGPMRWGEQARLQARVTWSDGESRHTPVMWHALDPDVVSVDSEGVITTNRPGSSGIVATAGGWRTDTIFVAVESLQVTEGVVLREDFDHLDDTLWTPLGSGPGQVVDVDRDRVLELGGGEGGTHGVVLGRPLALPRGGTVEFEFRTTFTRTEGQWIRLMVGELDPVDEADPVQEVNAPPRNGPLWGQHLSVTYPEVEEARFDPGRIVVQGNSWAFFDVPGGDRPGDWTHLALQVRADGEATLYMNHHFLGTVPGRLPVDPDRGWHVALLGSAEDTRLFVRDLVVWGEPRYGTPTRVSPSP